MKSIKSMASLQRVDNFYPITYKKGHKLHQFQLHKVLNRDMTLKLWETTHYSEILFFTEMHPVNWQIKSLLYHFLKTRQSPLFFLGTLSAKAGVSLRDPVALQKRPVIGERNNR